MNELPSELLTDYTRRFYGFGDWKAKVWFVGIEESNDATFDQVASRLRTWNARGAKELENAPDFFAAAGIDSGHGAKAKVQPAWSQLIRMLLLARGERDSEKEILNFQRTRLGTIG